MLKQKDIIFLYLEQHLGKKPNKVFKINKQKKAMGN